MVLPFHTLKLSVNSGLKMQMQKDSCRLHLVFICFQVERNIKSQKKVHNRWTNFEVQVLHLCRG